MTHPIRAISLAILAGAVSLGLAGCPKNGPQSSPGPAPESSLTQRASADKFGASIMVPPDWTVTQKTSNPVFFAVAPGAGNHGPMANLVVENLNQRMSPYDYLQANIITLRVSLSGLEIKNGGVELADPEAPAWIQFTYPRDQIKVEALTYCKTRDYRAYVVTMAAPADQFPQYERLFRAIGRSLRVE
ncbi:MAG TPA: hypothetical protein VM658_14910 [bacterium]|nr:hypothetical protein [bacterium]